MSKYTGAINMSFTIDDNDECSIQISYQDLAHGILFSNASGQTIQQAAEKAFSQIKKNFISVEEEKIQPKKTIDVNTSFKSIEDLQEYLKQLQESLQPKKSEEKPEDSLEDFLSKYLGVKADVLHFFKF